MLGFAPVDAAEPLPRGAAATLLSAGVLLTAPDVGAPVVPLPVLSAQFVRGVGDRADLRLRYDTVAVFAYRAGAELRVRLARERGWSFALGVEPSALFYALPYQGTYLGGDLATQVTALVSHRWSTVALTLDVGPTVQWAVFGQGRGRMLVDTRPHLAYLDVGVRVEWSRGPGRTATVGLDLCVPLDRDDPLGFLGLFPRVTLGWSWAR